MSRVKDLSLFKFTSFTQPHTVYKNSYCIWEFHSHLYETFCQTKSSLIPNTDSSFGRSLSGTLNSKSLFWAQILLKMIFKWHDRDRITSESRVRATGPAGITRRTCEYLGKNVRLALFALVKGIFVLFLHIYFNVVTIICFYWVRRIQLSGSIHIYTAEIFESAAPSTLTHHTHWELFENAVQTGGIWKRRLWVLGRRKTFWKRWHRVISLPEVIVAFFKFLRGS